MAFSGSVICSSFKQELMQGVHDLTLDVFKIALYDNSAVLDVNTTAYTAAGEVVGVGYTAGGTTLTNQGVATAVAANGSQVTFSGWLSVTFPAVTLACRGALIYNSSKANRAVAVLDFGLLVNKVAADLVVAMPVNSADTALIRF